MDKTPALFGQSGKMSAKGILLILFLVLFTLGFGVIGAGLCYSAHMKEKPCSAAAEGKVIKYKENSYIGQKRRFTPVVKYQAGNEIFTGETNVWYSSRIFETDEYVMIGYNPANPEEFYIKNYDLNIITRLGIIFLVIGGAILAVTVTILILDKERKKRGYSGRNHHRRNCSLYICGVCRCNRTQKYSVCIWGNGVVCSVWVVP